MTDIETLVMNRIKDDLKRLSSEGVGRIEDWVPERGKLYYKVDGTVIIVSVETED